MCVSMIAVLLQVGQQPLRAANESKPNSQKNEGFKLEIKRVTQGSEHSFMDGRPLELEILASDFNGIGGLKLMPENEGLYLSDTGNGIVYKYEDGRGLETYLSREKQEASGKVMIQVQSPTGLELDKSGKLIVCDQGMVGVRRRESKFRWKNLAVPGEKLSLSGPADILRARDGSYFFSDSRLVVSDKPQSSGIYRRANNGRVSLLYDGLTNPVGMAFSENEDSLFVANADSENPAVFRFEVGKAGKLTNPVEWPALEGLESFWESKTPSVIRYAGQDCLVVSYDHSISFFHIDGKELGTITMPEKVGSIAMDDTKQYLWVGGKSKLFRISVASAE